MCQIRAVAFVVVVFVFVAIAATGAGVIGVVEKHT